MQEQFLVHHGILGQKWGIRRYQNYDGTLIKKGSSVRRKTRYTNIDGSLNERGKLHSQNYINKQIDKNNKYYDRHIKKYDKLAEKYKDDKELNKKFKDMSEDAKRSRDSVNENIKKFGIDEIMANEKETRDKALKVAGAIGGTAAATAAGVALPALAVTGAGKVAEYLTNIDPSTGITKLEQWSMTPTGQKAERYVDAAIRGYSDVNAYVFSIYADQTLKRMQETGVIDQAGSIAGQFMNSASQNAGNMVNNVTSAATSNLYSTVAQNPELLKKMM